MKITETPFLANLRSQETYNKLGNDKKLSKFIKGLHYGFQK